MRPARTAGDATGYTSVHAFKGLENKVIIVTDVVIGEADFQRYLFYVGMTRARDALTLYAKQGKGKKDPSPPGYIREFLQDPTIRQWFRQRPARAFQADMFAGSAVPQSRTTQWLSVPPENDLSTRLSASTVQTYTTCPLQFKLRLVKVLLLTV